MSSASRKFGFTILRSAASAGLDVLVSDEAAHREEQRAVLVALWIGGSRPARIHPRPYAKSSSTTSSETCRCGSEDVHQEPADRRVRLDPLDATSSRHAGECEFASETDPAVIKIVLKVKDGAGGNDHWVECGGCGCGWQVSYYAESVV